MDIVLNGEPYQVNKDLTIADLVVQMGLNGRRLAIEINLQIIPRSAYANHILQPNDQVEIIHAIGGGLFGSQS